MGFDSFPTQEPNKTKIVENNQEEQEAIGRIGEVLDGLKHSGTAGFALAWENIGSALLKLSPEKQKIIAQKHGKTMELWNELNQRVYANNMDKKSLK